jgi:hypothetical protein
MITDIILIVRQLLKISWIIYWCELSPLTCKGSQLTMVYTYKQKHFKKEEFEDTKGNKRQSYHP